MNNQEKQKNPHGTDNSRVVTRGEGVGGVEKRKGSQIRGDRKRFDFVWWTYHAIYRFVHPKPM